MLRPTRPLRPIRARPDRVTAPARRRRASGRVALGLVAIAFALTSEPTPAAAQTLAEDARARPDWPVSAIALIYPDPHPEHPAPTGMLPVEVTLAEQEGVWTAPDEATPGEVLRFGATQGETRRLDVRGVVALLDAVVARLHDAGFYGVDVRPAAQDFDLVAERDLRPAGQTVLALEIRIGRIKRIRTIAVGDRIRSDWKIDNEIHDRIRAQSPLQPPGSGDDDATDLLDRRKLEDYLHRLNRRSERRVEAALSPDEEPGGVVLDYRVIEAKPWVVYGQVANTGTTRTNRWQARGGYIHRQLTDRDDTLHIEYLNAGGDEVNAVVARYEAPFFGAERPDWMSRRRGDPEWLDWIPREDVPWWGVDRLRWEGEFSWSESQAGESATQLGIANDFVKSGQLLFGGALAYEAFQHGNLFVDVWGGLRLRELSVRNRSRRTEGNALLVVPGIGLRAEKRSLLSSFDARVTLEGQLNEINETNREALGRARADDTYSLFTYQMGYTTYLEPIVNPKAWADPATNRSSTLAHEFAVGFRGQVTLDQRRLIPQANATLGGLYSVRGYPQSVAVGDTLVTATFEYRFHVPRVLPIRREPMHLPGIGDFRATPQQVYGRPDWDLVLRAFFDIGRTRRNDREIQPQAFAVNERHQTLMGAGVGAELTIGRYLRARIDWAAALKDENVNAQDGAPAGSPADRSGVNAGDSEIHVLFSILY